MKDDLPTQTETQLIVDDADQLKESAIEPSIQPNSTEPAVQSSQTTELRNHSKPVDRIPSDHSAGSPAREPSVQTKEVPVSPLHRVRGSANMPVTVLGCELVSCVLLMELIWLFFAGLCTPTPFMSTFARTNGIVCLVVVICYFLFIVLMIWKRKGFALPLHIRITKIALATFLPGIAAVFSMPIPVTAQVQIIACACVSGALPLLISLGLLNTRSSQAWFDFDQ